jgi:hypothetical protein
MLPLNLTRGSGADLLISDWPNSLEWNIEMRLAETRPYEDITSKFWFFPSLPIQSLSRTTLISRSLEIKRIREKMSLKNPCALTAFETSAESVSGAKLVT